MIVSNINFNNVTENLIEESNFRSVVASLITYFSIEFVIY